jgi:hypothetical protein
MALTANAILRNIELCILVYILTNVSEELITSIFMVEA